VSLQALLSDMLAPGMVLRDAYRLEYPIGRGAYGITYRARHASLDQIVAIKEFYPREHALRKGTAGQVAVSPDQQDVYVRNLERFVQQGRILGQLSHRNVVRVFDLFKERGTAYLVMELIDGVTLRDILNETPGAALPLERVEAVTEQLVGALAAVHEHRIYHLDVKPENILVSPEGRVVLVDFGASRQGFSRLSTQAFTVQYAAPEVVAGDDVGPDSDIFELAMILYEMLAGERPPCALERLLKKTDWAPTHLAEPWRGLLLRALAMKRSDRPTSVTAWWEARHGAERLAPPTRAMGERGAVEPGAVVVHPGGEALSQVVARATEGEVIVLGPGRHLLSTPIEVSRGVTLRGRAGGTDEIEYVGEGPAVRLAGPGSFAMRDVAIRRTSSSPGPLVEIRGGKASLDHCSLKGAVGGAGIAVSGRAEVVVRGCACEGNEVGIHATDKSVVSLEENHIHHNAAAGLVIEGHVEGTVRGNRIEENGPYGALIRGDARPILEANRCTGHKVAGLAWLGHGAGKAWYNESTDNEMHGILVGEQGGPILDTNQCESNRSSGIAYAANAGGSARGNECSRNGAFGILVSEQSHPALEENCCQENRQHGIAYLDQASGNCRSNQALRNGRDGIAVTALAAVQLIENVAQGNAGNGISLSAQAGGILKQNRVEENGESGISVSDDASPLLEANEVASNQMAGLLFRGRSQARASHNVIRANLYGVYVDDEAQPYLDSSRCTDNRASGIAFFGQSGGTARENEVGGNVHGLYLDDRAAPILEGNRCIGNRDSGLAWFGGAGGRARSNEASANDTFGICISDQASPALIGNRCYHNKGSGIHLEGTSTSAVSGNQVFQNGGNGIEIHQKSQPAVENNVCNENGGCGMVFMGSARGRAAGNGCSHNAESGIEVRDEARPQLEGNRCTENAQSGLLYHLQAGGTASANKASSNRQYGIVVRDRAHPRLEGNECEANKESGIAWFGSAGGMATGNRCNMNEVHGVVVSDDARPVLEGNHCSANLALDEMIPISLAAQKSESKG
jgi:parallel beta-helix repeat protein